MQEICQSGSEGGAKLSFIPTPISAQGFNQVSTLGKHHTKRRALKRAQEGWPWTWLSSNQHIQAIPNLSPFQGDSVLS